MTTARPSTAGLVRSLLLFAVVQGLLVLAAATLMRRFVWTDDASAQAIRASAWLAVAVQLFTFAVARSVGPAQVMVGWGLGVLLRFATLAFWALFGVKAMGVPSAPALLSLVLFYLVSTVIEPLFLNVHET